MKSAVRNGHAAATAADRAISPIESKGVRALEAGAITRSSHTEGAEMMYVNGTLISEDRQAEADLANVQAYMDKHGTALANAAYLLGGGSASRSVFELIDGIKGGLRISKAQVRRLERLHALLVFENVGDPDRLETALFAESIPGSRAVEEICLLARSLDDLLSSLVNNDQAPAERCSEAFSKAA